MPRIEPTVGRVVHFRPHDGDPLKVSDQPLTGQVAAVLPDGTVNLMVLDSQGNAKARQRVPLVQEGEEPPAHTSYCEWMAYQLGQAAKTEAAEPNPAIAESKSHAKKHK